MRYTYIVQCNDNTLYTGITTDLTRRVREHNESTQWASYTRRRRPVSLVWSHQHLSRSDASKEEYDIKQLSRSKKLEYLKHNN